MDLTKCKHCGRIITGSVHGVHAEGLYRGKHRCDPNDSKLPYGYEAEAIGDPCSIACLGSLDKV